MLAISATIGCVLWFVQATLMFLHISRLRTVARLDTPSPARWSTVSVIVPARDEALTIGEALKSRLDDDYPALQIVAVDDRSTDGTDAIIAEIAEQDPRVTPLRIDTLPEGWLGKVHALDRGITQATGEWLLLSDADVHIARGGLRKAIAYCEAEGLDFLALVPEFRSRSFAVDVLWSVFMRVLATFVDPARVRDPRSRTAMGSGAFMLARRSTYDRTPGFAHLRLDTTDDLSFGVMMKRAGARCDFANGRGIARVSIYDSVGGFFRGVEKNAGSLVRAPLVAVLALLGAAGFVELSPFIALTTQSVFVQVIGFAALVVATLATVTALRVGTGMVAPALLWPLGWLLVAAGIARSAWLLARRGGVVWRDTFYSREKLAQGQRFRML